MPKEEWGVKRLCPHCQSRFYDLNRDPMICPVCSNSFTLESVSSGRGHVLVADKTGNKQADLDVDDLGDDDLDDDAGDVDLDDDLLDEDDDDNVSLDDIADVSSDDDDN
ncbi:FYDLN acid domain-containing protein [Thioclava sp. GXIMD4216]|uniref:FYDLN acid domain-containing protein n=1 Tax=Thioclava litoralis TaxID=3076557 RepID=A0ABZ1DWB9_9RHOB|nr:FYDLN acid domain-containing protein [Thioclava sp. FTW29]